MEASPEVLEDEDAAQPVESIDWGDAGSLLGPTPQKNGRFLGLFDCLSPEKPAGPAESASPSKKRKAEDVPDGGHAKSSPAKTPQFLRKKTLDLDQDDARPRLLFHAPPKRGLSTLISELRQLEDEDEDEGMNVLREMEAARSQAPAREPPSEDMKPGEQEGPAMGDEKVKWKKKGLKRSHRRVIMRPQATTAKSRAEKKAVAIQTPAEGEESDEYINSADEAAADLAAAGADKPVQKTAPGPDNQVKGSSAPAKNSKKRAPVPGGVSNNFKSLKLRNTGSKGNSRFGRGRFGGRR